jgi:trk system potassium uptake protein TrkH
MITSQGFFRFLIMGELKNLNFRFIVHIIGTILIFEGLFMVLALLFAIYYDSNDFQGILLSLLITMFTGLILFFLTNKNTRPELLVREAFILVSFSWITLCMFGTLPYILSHAVGSYVDAIFETVSGFTTTGSSILKDIEIMPRGVLFWRSETHWIGGMGIIVLVLAVLPALKFGGTSLFAAESSVVLQEKIRPRMVEVAKGLWGIYILLTLAEAVLLLSGGMPLYDSLCHAFGTIATGGFSTKNAGIGGYSPFIQYVVMFFMFLAGINFLMHYFLLRGRFKEVIKNEELRTYFFIIVIAGLAVSLILIFRDNSGIEPALRHGYFQVVSILTATGFATTDYLVWPIPAWLIIFSLMFIGACSGSTGGGIKVIRHVILFKKLYSNLKQAMHPRGIINLKYNGRTISDEIIHKVISFILFYLLVFAVGTVIMTAIGLDIRSSAGSVITCLGGIGPGIGSVGPASNFAHVPQLGKIFLSFIMILGRLEIYTLLVVLTPSFWIS